MKNYLELPSYFVVKSTDHMGSKKNIYYISFNTKELFSFGGGGESDRLKQCITAKLKCISQRENHMKFGNLILRQVIRFLELLLINNIFEHGTLRESNESTYVRQT